MYVLLFLEGYAELMLLMILPLCLTINKSFELKITEGTQVTKVRHEVPKELCANSFILLVKVIKKVNLCF